SVDWPTPRSATSERSGWRATSESGDSSRGESASFGGEAVSRDRLRYCAARRPGGSVSTIDHRWRYGVPRREALLSLAGILAGAPRLSAQLDPHPLKDHRRVPGLEEMMSAFDFEPICFANMTLRNYDYMAHGSDSEFTLRR